MTNIHLNLPLWLIILIALLGLYGLFEALRKGKDALHVFWLVMRGTRRPTSEELETRFKGHLTTVDQRARELLDRKIRDIWRSFSPVKWLDLQNIREECQVLIREIAQVYYPSAHQPELQATVLELLKLNEKISREMTILLSPYTTLHQVSVATILEAKSLFEHTKRVVDQKGIRAGRRIAGRIWTTVNLINPQYWINKILFKGASEVVGRKVLSSIFRIVGTEAIAVYRSSSSVRIDPALLLSQELSSEEPIVEEAETSISIETSSEQTVEYAPEPPPQISLDGESTVLETEKPEVPHEEPEKSKEGMKKSAKESMKHRISTAMLQTLTAFVEGTLHVWEKLVNPGKVLKAFKKQGVEIQHIYQIQQVPIDLSDRVAERYIRKGEWLCAAEGAATGLGGFLLLAADSVSLPALQLRTIQQIGYCYGFDVTTPEEKLFTAKLLVEAYQHPAQGERQALLQEMRFAAGLLTGDTPLGKIQQRLFVQGFAKLAEKIGIRMGGRKVAQFLPLVGAAVGGVINKKVTKDIAHIAKDVYRDRRLQAASKIVKE